MIHGLNSISLTFLSLIYLGCFDSPLTDSNNLVRFYTGVQACVFGTISKPCDGPTEVWWMFVAGGWTLLSLAWWALTLYLWEKNSTLIFVVHLDLVLTDNKSQLFSRQSSDIVDSRIIITCHNMYLIPI